MSQLNRRNALRAAAALPALAMPATVNALPALDPIYAACERYEIAKTAYIAAVHAAQDLEETLPTHQRQWDWSVWDPEPPADCDDAPEWIAAQRSLACPRECKALFELAKTKPTTIAGCVHVLDYVVECWNKGEQWSDTWTGEYDPETGDAMYANPSRMLVETMSEALREIGGQRRLK
jgi:hypothetical protein